MRRLNCQGHEDLQDNTALQCTRQLLNHQDSNSSLQTRSQQQQGPQKVHRLHRSYDNESRPHLASLALHLLHSGRPELLLHVLGHRILSPCVVEAWRRLLLKGHLCIVVDAAAPALPATQLNAWGGGECNG